MSFLKPRQFILLVFVLFLAFPLFAQEEEAITELEEKVKKRKDKKDTIKTGWNFGGLPVVSYDSDLGLQFGALVNLYNYGDGSRYPQYNHSLYLEGSWFTKGSGIFRFYYDSDRLIKGVRTSLDLSYLPDQAFYFYGYNGYESVYNSSWVTEDSEDYKGTRLFYRYKREFFRFKLDFQGDIIEPRFKWLAGVDYYDINTSTINRNKFDIEDTVSTLFDEYKKWDIIPESEANGGRFTVFKLGLVYDSRDNEPNPWKGIWTEIVLASAPKFTSNMDRGFMKLAITHRQYFTLIKRRLSFAYRLAFQSTISGYTPTYAQTIMYYSRMTGAYNEGLGGGKTFRGIARNRVVGDGWIMGNFEFRYRFVYFNWIKQNWYLGLNAFFDSGRVIKFIDVQNIVEDPDNPFQDLSKEEQDEYFNFGTEGFHNSIGAGLYVAMNQNFIIAINFGKALDEQDGNTGFYIGLNYIF